MAQTFFSRYGIEAAWGSLGGISLPSSLAVDLGAGSQTGNVSAYAQAYLARAGVVRTNTEGV